MKNYDDVIKYLRFKIDFAQEQDPISTKNILYEEKVIQLFQQNNDDIPVNAISYLDLESEEDDYIDLETENQSIVTDIDSIESD